MTRSRDHVIIYIKSDNQNTVWLPRLQQKLLVLYFSGFDALIKSSQDVSAQFLLFYITYTNNDQSD